MDSSGSQEPPGEADEGSGCKSERGSPMPNQEPTDMDWTTASSSHLEQVAYVEDTPHSYGRASFATFEAATPFSHQQSTSLDYEHRVSPLDPNMSSAARYSPVYSMSNTLAVPSSPCHALAISNPSSPFPTSAGIANPSSPISSTNNTAMPVSPMDYSGNQAAGQPNIMATQRMCPAAGPSYSATNPAVAGPSGMLRQTFYHANTPSSPQSPAITPSDNFVSSSTGPAEDTMLATTSSGLTYLSQASNNTAMLDSKVDSTCDVATPLHDSHEIDSPSPHSSYSHEANPADGSAESEVIVKNSDRRHVEVLIGYEALRIVETDARFLAGAAESYLSGNHSMDPLTAALKARHGLVFGTEGLSREDLLGLKGRGSLLLDSEGNSSAGGIPLLLDASMAGLKTDGLVLEEMVSAAEHAGLEEGAVLETLKTRSLDNEVLRELAPCPQQEQEAMDTDGNLSRPLANPGFCREQHMDDLADDSLSDVVLLPERRDLEGEAVQQDKTSPHLSQDSGTSDGAAAMLRRSKRYSRTSQGEAENETSQQNRAWMQAKKRCDECYQMYSGECPEHRVQSISDKPVLARAWASLPAAYLAINKLTKPGAGMGVFARKTIPKRTQFGPLEGVTIKQEEFSVVAQDENKLELTIEMENGEFVILDTSSEHNSNWMRFVRPARCHADMNLVISQQSGALYYTTTRAILPRQELQVGYSTPYATKRHLPVLEPQQENAEDDTENAWPCFECNQLFSSSEGLQKHLNDHDTEREEEEETLKVKNKKTNRNMKRKVLSHLPIKKYKSSDDNNQSENEAGDFRCGTCSRSFPRSNNLKRHLQQHATDKKHLCNVCGQQFSHAYNRDRHEKKSHKKGDGGDINGRFPVLLKQKNSGEEGSWLCSHCHLTFETASMLNLHTLAHAAEDLEEQEEALDAMLDSDGPTDMQECPQCCQQYTSKRELVEHTSAHGKALMRRFRGTVNPAKPHKCDLCYKSFAAEDRLQRHMLVHGTEESKPLQCETCFKRFLNNSALACHIKVHTEEKKAFECPICRIMFEQVMALKDHVHIHATDGSYTCPHCSKVFDEYNQIRKHIRAFHSDKRFPCGLCEKVFPRPDKLKLHMLSLIRKHIRAFHSERKHSCSSCGKLFPTLDKLRMHMLRHSDHREFLCANCGKQFKRKDKLKEHMKRMHSAEREAKLAQKPHRQSSAKKFIPKVSPTDYQRFIYKCHSCLLGFKRRGMLVNHLAKRHPDISPDSVPELNLPILKTTRDYYCQYCDKVYKSSSKRKAHILKNHPGLELPMSNRRKGGVPDIPGVPNPTFSQTVGSITTHPHGCPWCHKQYASKAKLLQHQRKKHSDLVPQGSEIMQRGGCSESSSEGENMKVTSSKFLLTPHGEHVDVIELHGGSILSSQVNIIPSNAVEYQITTDQELQELHDSGIIIDATSLKRPSKVCGEGDMLSQAMSELTQSLAEFRSENTEGSDHYMKILHTGHIMVTQSADDSPLTTMDGDSGGPTDQETVTVTTAQIESSQLRHLLTSSYSLPPSPPPSTGSQQQSLAILPRGWAATFTSYTAR